MRCFLCRKKSDPTNNDFRFISTASCPASKKNLNSVLTHLANCTNLEIHIPPKETICGTCYFEIVEYDTYLVRTVRKREELSRLIEKSLVSIDSEFEDEFEANMENFDAELNELNFMEGMVVSDSEIDETIREATNKRPRRMEEKRNHNTKQTNEQTLYDCGMCSTTFRSKTAFLKHMNQAHKKYNCELCSYSHRNEDYVLLHQNLHEGRSENQCRFCEKEFTTKISTIRHMEAHMNTKKYQCDKCGLCFSQTTVLYNHKLQHEAEEKPLRCDVCNQMFKTKRTYRHHLITHQADRPRYACEHCNRTFTEKYTLKVHKRTHHDDDVQQQQQPPIKKERITQHDDIEFITEEIGDTETVVVSQHALDAFDGDIGGHDEIHDGGHDVQRATEKIFCCIICDQPFGNREQMNRHMEKDHDVILKALPFNSGSQYEVITESADKPCHICMQSFQNQNDLEYHLEHMHGLSFK